MTGDASLIFNKKARQYGLMVNLPNRPESNHQKFYTGLQPAAQCAYL